MLLPLRHMGFSMAYFQNPPWGLFFYSLVCTKAEIHFTEVEQKSNFEMTYTKESFHTIGRNGPQITTYALKIILQKIFVQSSIVLLTEISSLKRSLPSCPILSALFPSFPLSEITCLFICFDPKEKTDKISNWRLYPWVTDKKEGKTFLLSLKPVIM